MFHFQPCASTTDAATVRCEENKRKFIGVNLSRKPFLKVRVDGCLKIESIGGKRCDWLLIDVNGNIAFFIELKGSKVGHALLQLGNSIKGIGEPGRGFIEKPFRQKHAYAVLSRCPINSAEIQVEKKRFRKKYNTQLVVKNKVAEVEL